MSQAPPETLGDVAGRILRLEQPPDAIGPYWVAYSVKHDVVDPVRRWVADETQLYLDADYNVRASSVHREHSGEMAPVLGQAAVLLAPGANAIAGGDGAIARGPAATRELAQQIANVERIPTRYSRTVTVLETAEGPTLVAGGGSDLSAARVAAAQRLGLTPTSPMPGFHAEKTAIFGAGELGLTPTRGATSNVICGDPGGCKGFLEGLGAKVGKYTYEF